MAARRFSPKHDAMTREKIRTSQLINRLCALANGEIEMPPHAVTAALGLLRKTLPDLSSVEQTVTNVQPFAVLPNEIKDMAEWEQAANPGSLTRYTVGD